MRVTARDSKDVVHHRRAELACVRVLPAWMIAADKYLTVRQVVRGGVAEFRTRPDVDAATLEQAEICVEADLAERDDDSHARQRRDFGVEMRQAANDFLRRRLVVRRRAADRRCDERIAQLQSVVRAL